MLVDEDENLLPQVEEGKEGTTRVLSVLSNVVERLVGRNDQAIATSVQGKGGVSAFHGVRTPSISIYKYLERIIKYTNCSASCLVVGYIYMDRLVHRHPDSPVVSLNVHRLLLTCIMVASKVLDDVHYNNEFYAKVGGISNGELNRLELELLFLLDFSVVVTSSVFRSYCLHLEKEMMLVASASRRIERNMSNISTYDETEISIADTAQSSSP